MLAATAAFLSTCGTARAQSSDGDAGEEIEEVVVTGSRLVRRDLTAASPVFTVDSDALSSAGTGNVTVEESLNELPQLVADNTSSLNSPGEAGVWTADLRGLGPERTLVLVDGRRFTPASASGLTDLATIPNALIERAEIITGGASAVYGSDAVAGAVNFILKDDFEGVELQYMNSETFESDGATNEFSLTIGGNFASGRGNAVVNAVYTKRRSVSFADRSFSAIPLIDADGVNLEPSGSSNVPGVLLRFTPTQLDQIVGVDFDSPPTVDFGVQSGLGCTSVGGVRFGDGGQPVPFCTPEDNFNFAEDNYLLRPLQRYQLSSLASFDINDNIRLFSQLFYTHKENEFQQAPEARTLQSTGAPAATLLVPNADTNPLFFEPVREFFSDNRALFDPDGDGIFEMVGAARRFNELSPRIFDYRSGSWNITVGAEGEVEWLANNWRWEVFAQQQRADQDAHIQNQVSSLRLALGLDVVIDDDTGEPRCRNEFIGCVPLNLFGIDSLTPPMAEFLSTTRLNTETFERQVIGGSISGDLLELPAGPVPVALGVEARKDEFSVVPSAVEQAGEFSDTPPIINSGDVDVTEFFVETRIPLLGDLPLIDSLALETGARYSDYSSLGGVTTWKAGLDWQVTDWLRMRGTYNRAIRAPNLDELFAPPQAGFVGASDPCDARNNPSDAQKEVCVAQGISPADIDTFIADFPGVDQISGGNPELKEEESDTLTAGFVLQPPFLTGLDISIDYYSIEVDGAVALINAQAVIDTCFQVLDPDSTFCQAIHRLPSGLINSVDSRQQNLATLTVEGIDVQLGYTTELPGFLSLPERSASLDLRLIVTEQFENSEQTLPGSAAVDCAGFFGGSCSGQTVRMTPDHRGNLFAQWQSGAATIGAQIHWIGDFELLPGVQRAVTHVDAEYIVDLSGSLMIRDSIEIFAGINNVFDNEPTIVGFFSGGDPNVDPSTYDVLGRRYFVGARVSF
ncbi:MAG: TonB-dependent receptor [Woeseia sp.]